jgi:hypothetical protein
MRRGIVAALSVLVLVLSGAAWVTQPASATGQECTSTSTIYTTKISNRVDSGLFGNWAHDTFTRTTVVTDNCDGTYTVVLKDKGRFTTIDGAQSPTDDVVLAPKFTGDIVGGATIKVTSATPSHAPKGGQDGSVSTSDWANLLFDGEFTAALTNWGWTYEYCGQKWINDSLGNTGHLTGLPCTVVPKYEISVTGEDCLGQQQATVEIVITVNLAWHAPLVVPYRFVTNGPQHDVIRLGKSDTVAETGMTFAEDAGKGSVTVEVGSGRGKKSVTVKTDCLPPVTSTTVVAPPASTSTTSVVATSPNPSSASTLTSGTVLPVKQASSGGPGGPSNLAYTGTSSVGALLTAGGILLVLGGAALLISIQRRRRPRAHR